MSIGRARRKAPRTPARELRESLGWSQERFAQEIGWSYGSIQKWESGVAPPPEALDSMRDLALKYNRTALAHELEQGTGPWAVYSGEEVRAVKKPAGSAAELHAAVDEVIQSGNPDALAAVQMTLAVSVKYARAFPQRVARPAPKKVKDG